MSTDVVVAGNVTRDDVLALQAAMLSMAPAVLLALLRDLRCQRAILLLGGLLRVVGARRCA